VLENGDKIVSEPKNEDQELRTLSDHFITRFSTIKFFAKDKFSTEFFKASKDGINVIFPDYITQQKAEMLPILNG